MNGLMWILLVETVVVGLLKSRSVGVRRRTESSGSSLVPCSSILRELYITYVVLRNECGKVSCL